MKRQKQLPFFLAPALVALPVLKQPSDGLLVIASVFISVVFVEFVFFALGRIWPKPFKPFVAMVVLSTVLAAINSVLNATLANPPDYFPLCFLSAYFLILETLRNPAFFKQRLLNWVVFAMLIWFVSLAKSYHSSFLISFFILAFFLFFMKLSQAERKPWILNTD